MLILQITVFYANLILIINILICITLPSLKIYKTEKWKKLYKIQLFK